MSKCQYLCPMHILFCHDSACLICITKYDVDGHNNTKHIIYIISHYTCSVTLDVIIIIASLYGAWCKLQPVMVDKLVMIMCSDLITEYLYGVVISVTTLLWTSWLHFDRLLQTIKQELLSLVNTWFLDTYSLQWIQDSAVQFVIHLLL